MRTKAILIVDDEPRTRQGLHKMLTSWCSGSHRILTADNGRDAMKLLEETDIDLLITDIRMPEVSGLHLVTHVKERGKPKRPAVILVSGYAEFDYAHQALQLGVVNYLLKPVSKAKLIDAVTQALDAEEERSRTDAMRKFVDPLLLETGAGGDNFGEPVREAIAFVEARLEQAIGLREAAERVHLNASYFSVLFKEQTKLTFSEYVARLRLQKAKALLLTTKLPIAEIAERVGYQTAKYFNKVFRDYEGQSPGQFRTELAGDVEPTEAPDSRAYSSSSSN